MKNEETLHRLLDALKCGDISQKSFITKAKHHYSEDVAKATSFLDSYNPSIDERLYYIINDLHEPVKCKYCGRKASFSGRIKDGYRETCDSLECRSRQLGDSHKGSNTISSNRDSEFIKWQESVTYVDDAVIKEHIMYDKQLGLISNPLIIEYLNTRFSDSSSWLETLQRIRLNVEEKPLCPVCGNPVTWVGRKRALFTTYCSNPSCYNGAQEQIAKKKKTQLEHWGTEGVYDSYKFRELMKEKYGVIHVSQIDSVKKKRKETMLSTYGTTNIYAVPSIREKIEETCERKYGYRSVFQSPEVRKKMYESCIKNSKMQSSKAEDKISEELKNNGFKFIRHYRTDEFPYSCDFYLPDYNLRIEYQGTQYHNGRAFLGERMDYEELDELYSKSADRKRLTGKVITQYDKIIYTWTELDVKKRELAKSLHLPYLEIYSSYDVVGQIRFMISCLNKENPYNYSDEVLEDEKKYYSKDVDSLPTRADSRNRIVKHFQGGEFYRNEIVSYAYNTVMRREVIQNRMRFLHKKERELTISDIIRGYKISGRYYGYSHFNPFWVKWFIKKYNIHSIYDPCGGWGHHIIGMMDCDKVIYNELNPSVCENVKKIGEFIGIKELTIHNGNAIEYVPENVDAFFMCPPYFNVEDYGDGGFDSKEEYKTFLNRIILNWIKNSAQVFGIIIREDFVELIDYEYKEKFPVNVCDNLFEKRAHNEFLYIFEKQ